MASFRETLNTPRRSSQGLKRLASLAVLGFLTYQLAKIGHCSKPKANSNGNTVHRVHCHT